MCARRWPKTSINSRKLTSDVVGSMRSDLQDTCTWRSVVRRRHSLDGEEEHARALHVPLCPWSEVAASKEGAKVGLHWVRGKARPSRFDVASMEDKAFEVQRAARRQSFRSFRLETANCAIEPNPSVACLVCLFGMSTGASDRSIDLRHMSCNSCLSRQRSLPGSISSQTNERIDRTNLEHVFVERVR